MVWTSPYFSELCSEWWNVYGAQLSAEKKYRKRLDLDHHIIPFFGDIKVSNINQKTVEKFIAHLRESTASNPNGLKYTTISVIFRPLRKCLDYAVVHKYCKSNPAREVSIPKEDPTEVDVFTVDEVNRILESCSTQWIKDMITLAYRTGMRRGELCGLQWKDIDWEHQFLMVRRSVVDFQRQREIHGPKTKRSQRRIQLDAESMKMLRRRQENAISEWVFTNTKGEPAKTVCVSPYFRNACLKAHVPPRKFHALRHTHASILLANNVHPKIVQERLGHSSISMTLDLYSHLIPTMQQVAVDVFDNL